MKRKNRKTLLLFFRSYQENQNYTFDQAQIKNMFKDMGIKSYEKQKKLPKKIIRDYYTHSDKYEDLFALFFFLNHIKFATEKLDKSIFHQDFIKAKTAFDKVKREFLLTTKIFGELEDLIQYHFSTNIKLFTFDYTRFFDNLSKSILIYERRSYSEKFKELIRSDILLLEDRINTYKFILPFFIIILSPFYKKEYKDSAINVLRVLKILLNKSTLQYIQIQKKKVNFLKKVEKRGHRDGTTRILGIYTRYNDDVYLFRLDFPHVKEVDIHVNLHEKKGKKLVEAFYPMTKEEIDKLNIPDDLLNKITMFQEGLYWFKTNIKKIVAETSIPQDIKDSINKLYRQQSHFEFESGKKEKCYDKMLKYYIDIFLELNVSDDAVIEGFDREESKNVEIMQTIIHKKMCNDCLMIHTLLELGETDENIKKIMGLDDERYNFYKNEVVPVVETMEAEAAANYESDE